MVPEFGRFETGLNGVNDETDADVSTTAVEEDRIASLETRITQLETKVDGGFALLQKALLGIQTHNEQQVKQQQALEKSLKDQLSQLSVAVSQQKSAVGGGGGQTSGASTRGFPAAGAGSASRFITPSALGGHEEPQDEDAADPEDESDQAGYGRQQADEDEYGGQEPGEGGYGDQEAEEDLYGGGHPSYHQQGYGQGYGGYQQQQNYDDY